MNMYTFITNGRVFGGGGGGDFEHFDILVISWQFEHFWANNWRGINNSHKTINLWFNEKQNISFDIQNYIPKLSIGFNISTFS